MRIKTSAINKPKDFAVDGVLHYAKILSEDFDVIAIAVSGQNIAELKVSSYRWIHGNSKYKDEKTVKLLALNDYLKLETLTLFLIL